MNRPAIKFGLLQGLLLGLGFFGSHLVLGADPENFAVSEIVGYSIIVLCSVLIFTGMLAFRRHRLPQTTGFRAALWTGVQISLVGSALFAAYNWFYLEFINPEFTSTYMTWSEEQIRNSGLSADTIERQLQELATYGDLMSNNFLQAMVMFATVFIIGLLCALVGAAAIRNE